VAYNINIDISPAVNHNTVFINLDYKFQSTRPKHVAYVDETNKTVVADSSAYVNANILGEWVTEHAIAFVCI
jgi:hypothetical protein